MRAFQYLSVLVSIVLGLGMAHLLAAFARALSRRGQVPLYWPSLVWAAALFLVILQVWWADFSMTTRSGPWTFAGFLAIISIPCGLYLLAYLIMPESQEPRSAYLRNSRAFYSILIVIAFLSALQQYVIDGRVHLDADTALKAVAVLIAAAGIILRNEPAQKYLAVIGAAWVLAYIFLLFGRLPTSY
jgi:hypothetical protein